MTYSGTNMLASIRTQVMWNRLISVVEEQAQALFAALQNEAKIF